MALALLCTGSFVLEAPAEAQSRTRNQQQEAPKTNYSKPFIEAYQPVDALSKATPLDETAVRAGIATVVAAVSTDDDRHAAGGLVFNVGAKLDDLKFQYQGLEMMLASNKLAPELVGQYQFSAGQVAYNDDNYAAARDWFIKARESGYQVENVNPLIAETYFQQDMYAEGLAFLRGLINEEIAAGRKPSDAWIKRGFAMAYNNDQVEESVRFSALLAKHYPARDSWGDAIAVQRAFFEWDDPTLLDLMRLAWRTDSMRGERDYVDYLSSADARRLPFEVKTVADKGVQAGVIDGSDVFIAEALSVAASRIEEDRRELPALERDANAASATLVTVNAAADTFLSYDMSAQAEVLYTKALAMPGVDANRVNTRLGIALADQGKFAEAKAAFDKVEGPRAQIVALWKLWVAQQQAEAAPAEAAAPVA